MSAPARFAATIRRFGIRRSRSVLATGPGVAIASAALLVVLAFPSAALAAPPAVTIEPASQIGVTSALAKGEVDPEGTETSCHFEYVVDFKFQVDAWAQSTQVACNAGPLTGDSAQGVQATLEGLEPDRTYHLRLVAENVQAEDGLAVAPNFDTDAVVAPVLALLPATQITSDYAVLHATIDPEGGNEDPLSGPMPISWELQYTLASKPNDWRGVFINIHPEGPITGADAVSDDPVEVSGDAIEMQPGEPYLYRLVASYFGGQVPPAEGGTFETPPVPPRITETHAISIAEDTATVTANVQAGGSPTTFHFEYVTKAAFEATGFASAISTPESVSIGADNSARLAEAPLAGLQPDSDYRFRAVATNEVETVFGVDRAFHTLAAELPEEEDVCPNATLRVETNSIALPNCRAWELASPPDKNGGEVRVRTFRTHAAVDCTTDCAVVYGSLSGFADTVGGTIETTYISERDPGAGGNGWRTHSISPVQDSLSLNSATHGGEAHYASDFSPDLDKAVYRTFFPPLTDYWYTSNQLNLYVRSGLRHGPVTNRLVTSCPFCEATNTMTPHWLSDVPNHPELAELDMMQPEYVGHSDDFEFVVFESRVNYVGDDSYQRRLYGTYPDGLHMVSLVPPGEAPSCGATGPECVYPPASVNAVPAPAAVDWAGDLPNVVSSDGSRVNFQTAWYREGIPRDPEESGCGACFPVPHLYQRNSHGTATVDDDTTVRLDISERTATVEPSHLTFYETASADGHVVFFRHTGNLTDEAPPGDRTRHLYMWRDDVLNDEVQKLTVDATAGQFRLLLGAEETGDLPFDATPAEVANALEALPAVQADDGRITVTGGPGDGAGTAPYTITFEGGLAETDQPTMTTASGTTPLSGGPATATVAPWSKGGGHLTMIDVDRQPVDGMDSVTGVIGASSDGHYLYFQTTNQLIAGRPPAPQNEPWGGSIIYLWHDGALREIGTVLNTRLEEHKLNLLGCGYVGCKSRAVVSPDGNSLLFSTVNGGGLTGYDHGNNGCQPGEYNDEARGCFVMYLYHADSDELRCATCNPTSQAATTDAEPWTPGGTNNGKRAANSLSRDGRFVFFSSAEALVPGDTNGVTDAYQYDYTTDRIELLSSGTSKRPTYFLEASANGSDVFIATAERLSRWDQDSAQDVYDVRAGGGIPEPPLTSPPCSGDSCVSAAPDEPLPPAAASESFVGPGDPKPKRRCSKGRRAVRVPGKTRCVRKKHPKHKRKAHQSGRTSR